MSTPELVVEKGKVRQAGTLAPGPMMDKVRLRCETDLYYFSKLVMGFGDFSDGLHKPTCEWLQRIPPRRKCLLMPRDHFKTSIAQSLVCHIILQPASNNCYWLGEDGSNLRILYAAETVETAEKRLGFIQQNFEANELLRALWPHKVWPNVKDARDWSKTKFTLPRSRTYPESTLEISGVGTAVTGRHYNIKIEDDLIGAKARNEISTTMPAAIDWYKTSEALMHPPMEYLEFIFGTRWAHYDLYSWAMKNVPQVEFLVRKIVENGQAIFPELMNMDYIETNLRPKGEIFWLNYMNEASGAELTAFDTSRLRYFELTPGGEVLLDVKVAEARPDYRDSLRLSEPPPIVDESDKPKRLWELTPAERNRRWQQQARDWRKGRERRAGEDR